MNKGRNKNVNQNLWRRFLEKKGYDGIYCENGVEVHLTHSAYGIFYFISHSTITMGR